MRSSAPRLAAVGFCAALVALGAAASLPARAQSDSDVENLVRDQRTAQTRIRALRDKMERLAQKLDHEGRAYAASLLRNAMGELDRSKIESQMNDVAEMQEKGELNKSLSAQEKVLGDIENLLQILQDKKSLDKIDQLLEQMKNALESMAGVKKEEQEVLDQTRDAEKQASSDSSSRSANPELQAVAKKLTDLAARQDELRAQTEAKVSESMKSAEQALAAVSALKSAQEKALNETEQRESRPKKGSEASPDGAKAPEKPSGEADDKNPSEPANTGGDKASGEKPSDPSGKYAEKPADDRNEAGKPSAEALSQKAAVDALAKRLEDARQRTQSLAEGKPSPDGSDPAAGLYNELEAIGAEANAQGGKASASPGSEEAAKSLKEAADKVAQAAKSLQSDDPETAGAREDEALSSLHEASESLGRSPGQAASKSAQMSRELRGLGDRAAELGKEFLEKSKEAGGEGFEKASDPMYKAAEKLGRASNLEGKGQGAESGDEQKAALEGTAEAEKALQQLMAQLAAKDQGAMAGLSQEQKALEQAAREAAAEAAKAASQSSTDPSKSAGQESASEATKAAESMSSAESSLQSGKPQSATEKQAQASQELRRAAEKAAEAAAGPMNEETKEILKRLQKRQDEIEATAKELEEKTGGLPNSAGQKSVGKSRASMKKASQSLSHNDPSKASEKEDEALKYLSDAEQEIQQRQQEYRSLEQEEVLFRVKDKIDKIVKTQRDVNLKTLDLDSKREQQEGSFTRAQKIRDIPALSADQKQLKADVDEIDNKLKEENSPAFTWVLDLVSADMDGVADRILAQDLGEGTRDIQSDIVSRLVSVSEAFKDELQRRQAERSDPQGANQNQPQGQQDQRLVPLMTELKLLRQMQLDVLRKRSELAQRIQHSGASELTPEQKALLARLASQQAAVNQVFQNFKKVVGIE